MNVIIEWAKEMNERLEAIEEREQQRLMPGDPCGIAQLIGEDPCIVDEHLGRPGPEGEVAERSKALAWKASLG